FTFKEGLDVSRIDHEHVPTPWLPCTTGAMSRKTLAPTADATGIPQDDRPDNPGMMGPAPAAQASAARPPRHRARGIWMERDAIFRSSGRQVMGRALLELARTRCREDFSVDEAAFALGISARQLHRLSIRTLGFPPSLVLDVARVSS